MIKKEAVLKLASELKDELVRVRRHLHTYPELSFEEIETSKWIREYLQSKGLSVSQVAGTGLVTSVKGALPGDEIALRADIDALPIQEMNDVPYKSVFSGVMHACGHDVHATCLIGALMILEQLKDDLHGTVKAVFQPGEEKLPGGATMILDEKVLEPNPSFILAQHVYPELPAGKVGFRPGVYMASTDELYFTITGKGGHAALPHKNIDPVVAAARVITTLQEIVSRSCPPSIPCVLSIGKVIADGATNVIPDQVTMEGTFRTMDESWREKAHELISKSAKSVCEAVGASCEVEVRKGYPVLVNHPETTMRLTELARELLGDENVVDLDIRMTAEDFAWYSQQMNACFYRLGTAGPDGTNSRPVHSSSFDINEDALVTGSALMAWLALKGGE